MDDRFEIYLGKQQHNAEMPALDNKTGPAAVIRNMRNVLNPHDLASGWRVIAIDRFYTAIPLLVQLLNMKMYSVGTIMTNRLGYPKEVINNNRKGTRGEFKACTSVKLPTLRALSWFDKKPVHFLSTGASIKQDFVTRRVRGVKTTVHCPSVVSNYHQMMGGVDRHDQLRLQRYSLQTSYRFRKYYKSLFMGLVDLVLVNMYVTHTECAKRNGTIPLNRASFMTELHSQMVRVCASDFPDGSQASPATPSGQLRSTHTIAQNDNFRTVGKQQMRRRNACKVCSIKFRKKGQKSNDSSWYCVQCSEDNKRLFLCNTIRVANGNTSTCFDIWHNDWQCKVPATANKTIQMRPSLGKRKRKRVARELEIEDNNHVDQVNQEEDTGDNDCS